MTSLLALSLAATAGLWPATEATTPPQVIASDLVSRDPGRRVAAIIRLGSLGRPEDWRRLTPFLDGGDASLRLAAARILVRTGEPGALGRIAAQAADERASVRFEALTLLREAATLPDMGRRAAERALGDADPAMRLVAMEVLTAHPAGDSVPVVAGSIGDSNREVRLAALRLLGLSRDARAVLPLLERIDGSDRHERLAVIDALGAIGAGAALDAGPALLRQLGDSSDDVRAAAVDAIGRLRFPPAAPALRAIAARTRDGLARRAVLALGAIADPAALDALVSLLREAAPAEEVVVALRRAGAPAVKPVAAILPTAYPTSAAAATTILADIGDRAATPALLAVLKARPLVAPAAARALGALRDPEAVAGLMAAATDPRHAGAARVREACLRALADIGDNRAAAVVQAAAEDGDPDVRSAALRLATVLRRGLSRDTLAARLVDRDPTVRRAAIAATPALSALRPASLLLDVANRGGVAFAEDPDTFADALASVATEADGPTLWATLEHASGSWRVALLRALATLPQQAPQSTRAGSLLIEALVSGGAAGRAAAEILSDSKIGKTMLPAVVSRLHAFESATRARLCPALAQIEGRTGDDALADLMDRDPDPGVRAAAAWAARRRRGSPAVGAALDRSTRSVLAPVAANAMAALADLPPRSAAGSSDSAGAEPRGGVSDWARIRLLTAERGRAMGRWVRVSAGELTIWALTDDVGEARLTNLPPGPLRITVEGSNLQLAR